MDNSIISGRKGKRGGSGYRAPKESPNTLQSIQRVALTDIISEGPIVGLYNGDKSIYLNETPLRTAGGTLTYHDVSWQQRPGAPDQAATPYDAGAETEVGVSAEVTNLYPKGKGPDSGRYQFSVTNAQVTRLRLTLGVQALYETRLDQAHAGDLTPASVSYRVVITDGAGHVVKDYSDTIKGKTTSQYFWARLFSLTGPAPWLVTVSKTTPDSKSSTLNNDLYLSSYTEIIGYSFSYPHTALVSLSASAETFGGPVPSRIYRVKGLKIRVPSNYDPDKRTYTGVWDGTFKIAWTDNPAWVLYDLITNDRYGVSKYLPHSFIESHDLCDKWFLYRVAQICDELVPDGKGGKEPRYTFNGQVMGAGECRDVVQSLASVFHGMTYWSSGLIYARADYPSDPIRTITQANVVDGVITYASASMQERHSVALVTWYDPADLGRAHVETVTDWDAYLRLGYRPIESVAYGCYSRGQAHRHGRWLLASEATPWTATVELGFDGFDLLPGDIVKLADPAWMGYRASGRVKSISGTTVTLDAPVETRPGESYRLSICDDDGGEETRVVTSVSGATVTVASAFTKRFVPNAVWSIAGTQAEPRQFRVQSVKETDHGTVQVTLMEYNPKKYVEIEQNLRLEDPPASRRPKADVDAPVDLSVLESTATVNGKLIQKALLSWRQKAVDFSISGYKVQYIDPLGNADTSDWRNDRSLELTNVIGGEWTFRVQAMTLDGRRSPWSELKSPMAGVSALTPKNVYGLRLTEWGYMTKDGTHISNVDATWSAPEGMNAEAIAGYELFVRYGTNEPWQKIASPGPDERKHTITGVRTNQTLSVLVKTKSKLDIYSSGVSESLKIVGKDEPPATPAGFAVRQSDRDRTQLLLSWKPVPEPDIAGYRVYLDDAETVHLTPATSATVTLLASGAHTLKLTAVDNSGQESKPAAVSGSYTVIPGDVTGLKLVQSEYERTTVILSWDVVPGKDIKGYEVREGISWDAGVVVSAMTQTPRLELRIDTERAYCYWVVAHTVGGTSSQTPQSVSGVFELNPKAPTGLAARRDEYDATRLQITWTPSPDLDVVSYELRDGLSWGSAALLGVTASAQLTVTMPASHEYNILLRAKNKAGLWSDIVTTFYAATLEPSNVRGFQAVQDGGSVAFLWLKNPETDIAGYELREGFTWDTAQVIADGLTQTEATIPVSVERAYHYMIKAINRAGYYSPQPATASLTVEHLPPKNVLLTWDDIALQDGTHKDTRFATNPVTWANTPGRWSDYADRRWLDMGGGLVLTLAAGKTSGVWTSPVRDAKRVISANLSCDFVLLSRSGGTAELQFRVSQDGTAWTNWARWTPHQGTLCYIQYRVIFTAKDAAHPPYVTVLRATVDMPDVVKAGRAVVSATQEVDIDYGFVYAIPPTVVLTADGATKRALIVGTPGVTSCRVKIVDTAGKTTTGVINWTSYGY